MTIETTEAEQKVNGAALDESGFLKTDAPVIEPGSAAQSAPTFEPPKKRRGRPPGSGKLQAEGIPASGNSSASKGSTKTKAKSYTASDASAMAEQIVGMHQMVALMTGLQELVISEKEGKALADAIVNVSEQYDLAIDGKTGAALQLAMAAAMVYAPRVLMIKSRAAQAKAAQSGQVFTENGQPT